MPLAIDEISFVKQPTFAKPTEGMKILIAADSFKDALPAQEICTAIARGVHMVMPHAEVIVFPLGDGGEGTAEVLTFHTNGKRIALQVHDPLFRPVTATYGISEDGQTAFIEMAQAAGLQLLSPEVRNPLLTSTYGVGEMIRHALATGARHIVLCIGGSATNDGGIGMAYALGYRFYSAAGLLLKTQMTGAQLIDIQSITSSDVPLETQVQLQATRFTVLCDVDNPLFGERGAAQVYARQKGADDEAIKQLDTGLEHFAKVLQQHFGQPFAQVPGAGAAGGLGAGAMAFLGAQLQSGIHTVLDLTNFDAHLDGVNLILTGEGKIDAQTLQGKLISGVVQRARDIPVVALCGTLLADVSAIQRIGLAAAFSILNQPLNLPEALEATSHLLQQTTAQVISLWRLNT